LHAFKKDAKIPAHYLHVESMQNAELEITGQPVHALLALKEIRTQFALSRAARVT
jgi:hypothetical protein